MAYRWRSGVLDPLKDGSNLLELMEQVEDEPERVRSYTVDRLDGPFGCALYALADERGFVVEMVWIDGTTALVLFEDEGSAMTFLLTSGMAMIQAAAGAATLLAANRLATGCPLPSLVQPGAPMVRPARGHERGTSGTG